MASKGHWPRGKPRHAETATLTARKHLVRLRRFFARQSRPPGQTVNASSIRSAAAAIGVSDRSIRRWLTLSKQHHPDPAHLRALIAWRKTRPEA